MIEIAGSMNLVLMRLTFSAKPDLCGSVPKFRGMRIGLHCKGYLPSARRVAAGCRCSMAEHDP